MHQTTASTGGRRIRSIGAAIVISLLAGPAMAYWQEQLTAQLRWDLNCEVRFFSGVTERVIDGHMVVIVKAHCEDGRVFDAIQRDEFEDFEITECRTTEQAC